MPKPKLGERIEDWLRNLPVVGNFLSWQLDFKERQQETEAAIMREVVESVKEGKWGQAVVVWVIGAWKQIVGGADFPAEEITGAREEAQAEIDAFTDNPSVYLADKLQEIGGSDQTREITQAIGAMVMDPVIGLFESYATDPEPDIHEFSRSFHGYMMSLSWGGSIMDSVLKVGLGERAPSVKDALSQMYWSMGLGFLGWQTLAPLLSSGLQPNLERYYNKLYTPARFTPSQASDLFALGEWGAGEMQAYLQEAGWRDTDIQTWIDLSYRSLSEGVLWGLYETGELSKTAMDARLRKAGYDPDDLPLLYLSHEPEEAQEAKRFLISTVKRAFKEQRLGETEFRAILAEQNYQDQIIDMLVDELTLARVEEEKALSEGNIRLLYTQRVIGRDEAIHHLQGIEYTAEVAGQLVEAWDRQTLPRAARLNKGTILEGYTDGVLQREETKELLQRECGYEADKAELILQIEEAGRPEPVQQVGVGAASLSMLSDWVQAGLITRAEIEDRAELERFSEEDRERIISLMFLAPGEAILDIELDPVILEQAYVYGVMSRDVLLERLLARGLSEEDAELTITTLELSFPEVFGEFPAVLMRQPSVASIQLALQREMIDEAGFRERLQAQGYTLDAIEIFLFNAQYQLPAEPRKPTKADLVRWLKERVINRAEFIRRMTELGYLATDIDLYLAAESPSLEDTLIADLFSQGYIDQGGFVALAAEMGYTAGEIEEFLHMFEQPAPV